MEVAHVEPDGRTLTATGTQLGAGYELRYRLGGTILSLELVGRRAVDVHLGEADHFDLGFSPLFNSLPVLWDGLLEPGPPRTYVMCWVDVPSLDVSLSEQEYEPLGDGLIRFRAAGFTADIRFDAVGFVVDYPGIAKRV
jgi:hypothetical protein